MNKIDRTLEDIQRQIELYGKSGSECVFLTNIQFTIKAEDFTVPSGCDGDSCICDVSWFFKCAKARMIVPCGYPDSSFFIKKFGSDVLPYGANWNIEALVDNLKNEQSNRRGILLNHQDPYNPPCVVCYHFQEVKYGKLDCTVTMRSSDVAKVLPGDVFISGIILEQVAEMVGMETGDLVFNISNAHVYYEDLEYTEEFTIDYGD